MNKLFIQNMGGKLKKYLGFTAFLLITLCSFTYSVSASVSKMRFSNGSIIALEVARTDKERSKGLMFRENLDSDKGMVFIFKPKQAVNFWMKNTLIPLDIIFIDTGIIVRIAKNTLVNQTETTYPSIHPITEVVEVNAGYTEKHNIKVGDKVSFYNIEDISYSKKSIFNF